MNICLFFSKFPAQFEFTEFSKYVNYCSYCTDILQSTRISWSLSITDQQSEYINQLNIAEVDLVHAYSPYELCCSEQFLEFFKNFISGQDVIYGYV
jgi:hypothetical protein